MANQYKNKVVFNGTTLMDISDTTAIASDVASGKYFYLATGEKMAGIASGGGGGLETENVIPSQSVDCSISLGDGSYGGLISNQTEYPTDEIYYLVTFDGVDYIARGHDVSSSIIVIGDYNATTSNTYLEFPFAVIYQGESLFYLAVQGSGTHTLKVDKILSFSGGGSGYTRTVIAEEQTTTPVSTSLNGSTYYSATLNVSEGFEADAEYIITFNGTEYFFTCQVLWGTNYLLGEINYFYGGSDFPYPFGIIWISGTTCTLARDNGNQVTVKIEKLELTGSGGGSATLITKTITQNGTYDAEDDSADGYSSVTVNVSGVNITNGIVITATDADYYVTSVDYYGEVLPRYIFGAGRGDQFSWSRLRSIDFKSQTVYLTRQNFFYCGLYELSTTAIKGRDPSYEWKYNNNTQDTGCFRNMKSLVTLSLPEFVGFLNHYEIAGCTALKTVYLPKVTKVASYGSNGRGAFRDDTSLESVQLGSVGFAVDAIDTNPFQNCTQTGLTITIYTTGSYVDTAVANTRRGATNATIIIKASEATTYSGTSYAAGDTIVTSTP